MGADRFEPIWEKESMNKGATCLQLPHTDSPTSPCALGLEGELCTELFGSTQVLDLNCLQTPV